MKRKTIYFLVFLLSFFVNKSMAQSFVERLHFEIAAGSGYQQHGIKPLDFSFKANVDILPSLYAFLTTEGNNSLYKRDGMKTYFRGESIGGGLGFKLLNAEKTSHTLDVRAKIQNSIGGVDWKRTTYDASLAWYLHGKGFVFTPVVELGYRYINSHTHGIDNYGNIYMSIGIRY